MIIYIIIISIIMKFFGREKELGELEKIRSGMAVIYGRRRIGKTELIKQLIKDKKAVYFFVNPKKTEKELLLDYVQELKEKLDLPEYIKVERWEEFLKLIFDLPKTEKLVIAFDEFQRFLQIRESIVYDFQKFWDLSEKKPYLIFSGSSIGTIKKIFIENKAPLFKRSNLMINLEPFSFFEISVVLKKFGIKDIEEQVKIYCLFGGIIYYYTLIESANCKNFDDIMDKLILNQNTPLRREVRDILVEEFGKDYSTYLGILTAISLGKTKRNEIADYIGFLSTSLSPYFFDLIDLLEVIKRQRKITEKNKSKDTRYMLKDNFINFWLKYIHKNESYFEIGEFNLIKEKIKKHLGKFFGLKFEGVAKELLIKLNKENKLPFKFEKIGNQWGNYREDNKRKEYEIDLVVLNEDKKEIGFFEVKWRNLKEKETRKIIEELKETLVVPTVHRFFERKTNESKFVEWNNKLKNKKNDESVEGNRRYLHKRKEFFGLIAKKIENKPKFKREGYLVFDLEDF